MATTQSFEGLGTFYLGAPYDLAKRERAQEPLLYESKHLVTHAVCVGMTGSGKTGLCTVLLEEAAIDGIPALVIDPKGDLANLMLGFPDLAASDFAPWVDPDAARQKGLTTEAFAAEQAESWKRGLAAWGQDGERIARMHSAAEFAVYTPGSSAARPVSILKSFAAPGKEALEDGELLRERVATTVSSLLALAGVDSDPVQGREHILLATIVQRAWSAGRDLDIGALIQDVQKPPVDKVGVLDLESFYPSKERFQLALALNNLLASPGFQSWMQGEALDVQELLYTKEGKPRVAIFSIAHLGDAQRMFFVSLLLNQVLGWVRAQRGTSSLRALLYMDEIAGYVPPVANPPSKAPLLTLMKQARAFGFGVVLATQNPVDLDYKGLANAGTWFIGRLQTERDKARLLDGLEGASGASGFDRASVEKVLSALEARVFLLHDVHEDGPVVFESRWALSYLRGPMTREELKGFAVRPAEGISRPVLPSEIQQYFVPVRSSGAVMYRPALFGCAKLFFADAKARVEEERDACFLVPCSNGPVSVDWDHAEETELAVLDLEGEPLSGAGFAALPADCARPKSYDAWKKAFADHLFRNSTLELFKNARLGLLSTPGETEGAFRVRLAQAAREARDAEMDRVRAKYAPKLQTLEERARKREQAIEVQEAQAREAKTSTVISFGSTVLSALFGRKAKSVGSVGRAATTARGVGRSLKESGDVDRAAADLRAVEVQKGELEAELQQELAEIQGRFEPAALTFERVDVRVKKTGITVKTVVLAWVPWTSGRPAWR